MSPRTDMRQTKMMFLTPEGLWSVSTPFLDEVPGVLLATLGNEFLTSQISSVLHAAVPAGKDLATGRPNRYLERLAGMYNAQGDQPFVGTAILTGGFAPPSRTSSGGWILPQEWVRPINDTLIRRVKGIVAQENSK